ncbi:hypothetical protein FHQ18_07990 [Deferribacter autotrophicus]|uniref:Lipoprotein n=1 Tax=Deferribacter autotrophicus TaxID=500465 RepID=A0A5A8F2I0_9BACT|nr:hypothetical protein [Deferribacter autotrophicus]KAA0257674.1 hypothetical protein FHQ18_07990 [Deferribacter autotrophicus]
MKKVMLILFLLIFFAGGCAKKIVIDSGEINSIDQSLNIIKETLNKNSPSKDYKYYKTIHSDNFRLLAFTWVHKKKDKLYIKTAEVYGKSPKVYIARSLGEYFVKVSGGTIYGCYGTSKKEPVIGFKEIKVDWNLLDNRGCDQSIKISFNNKEDAERFAEALAFLLKQYKEEPDMFEKIRNEKTEIKVKSENKCSVDKILKMKEIGLTREEIKKICE